MHVIKKTKWSLLTHIVLLISIVVFASMALSGALFALLLDQIVTRYVGQQALTVAKMTAMDPRIVKAFESPDPSSVIQPIAEQTRLSTGASYVVVGNKQGIRYSHSNPEQIGKEMVGGDNAPVLSGESIISEAVGSLGPSLRGKTPVLNADDEIIGIVSVGFLSNQIDDLVEGYHWKVASLSSLMLIVGSIGAYFTARRIKQLIFGLEPEEIAFLFQEKNATLESIRDSIVAVNLQGVIVTMNRTAREMLQKHQLAIGDMLTPQPLRNAMEICLVTKQGYSQQRVTWGAEVYAIHVEPILHAHRAVGAVFTLYTESEIEKLTDEFSKIKAFSDNMRAQTHEYLNKLNTIYGLLTLGHYDKATEMIAEEVKERQDIIEFLVSSVRDPLVAACLLGKTNRAKELKVQLEIDPDSELMDVPAGTDTKTMVTIIGNLIDNGMEAAREHRRNEAVVRVSFTDLGNDIIFDIEDNGPGIPRDKEDAIFISGYSSKPGENRGLGLAIVRHALHSMNGHLFINTSKLGGAHFTVVFPKMAPTTL
ncbi:ATP-binding protein [Paenibacillus silviterrae]|uniref:ATP-binding protein n=1 Tax=Paenibacillus silviterrae TaxID=3242194 RepID=UPI00254336B1|nr:sensor histidine kinase [Paenibacillus chinjuensis]